MFPHLTRGQSKLFLVGESWQPCDLGLLCWRNAYDDSGTLENLSSLKNR